MCDIMKDQGKAFQAIVCLYALPRTSSSLSFRVCTRLPTSASRCVQPSRLVAIDNPLRLSGEATSACKDTIFDKIKRNNSPVFDKIKRNKYHKNDKIKRNDEKKPHLSPLIAPNMRAASHLEIEP